MRSMYWHPRWGWRVPVAPCACTAAGVYRDDARRRHLSTVPTIRLPRPAPPLALSGAERQALKDVLC